MENFWQSGQNSFDDWENYFFCFREESRQRNWCFRAQDVLCLQAFGGKRGRLCFFLLASELPFLCYMSCFHTHTVRHAHTFLLTCAKTQFVFKGKCFYMSNFNSAISQMEPCQCEFLLPCPLTSAFSSLPYKQRTTQRFISTICVQPRAANWKSITGFDCELQQSSRDVRGWPGLICLHWG